MEAYAMASVRARADTGQLFFDFRFKGIRCREQTSLEDNKTNRSKMEKILIKIEEDIEADRFDYRRYFPNSKNAEKFDAPAKVLSKVSIETQRAFARSPSAGNTPLFGEFVEQWFNEFSVGWRRTYINTVRQIIDTRLVPEYGQTRVSDIHREDIWTSPALLDKS
jgi:integrase